MKLPSAAARAACTVFCLGLACAAPPVAAGAAADKTPVVLDAQEQAFIAKATADNTMQVTLAKLAQARSSSSRVKALAQRIIDDHTELNNVLSRYAYGKKSMGQSHGVPPQKVTTEVRHLKQLHGDAFDQAFARLMVTEHEKVIPIFRRAAQSLNHTALRKIASDALPLLQAHLDAARAIVQGAPKRAQG